MDSLVTITISGWMCNELNLKGNELLVYALIYSFSKDGNTRFYGSRDYIANTFNISLPTVDKALSALIKKSLVEKTTVNDERGSRNEYSVCKETLHRDVKKLYGGSKETLHNTGSKHSKKNEVSNSKELLQKPENLYQQCLATISTYTQDTKLQDTLKLFLEYRLELSSKPWGDGKPFYFGHWTHLLNELRHLMESDTKLGTEIVLKSLERGWKHFYPLTDNNFVKNRNPKQFDPARSERADFEEVARQAKEREKRGQRVSF